MRHHERYQLKDKILNMTLRRYYCNKRVYAATVVFLSAFIILASSRKRARKSRRKRPKFHRQALMRPIQGTCSTSWLRMVSFGTSSDFISYTNVSRPVFFSYLLPRFEARRNFVNNGSPYRSSRSSRGRPAQLKSVDILGLSLNYLKRRDILANICTDFGLVPSSLQIWLDFGLEVLLQVVRDPQSTHCAIRWPSHDEIAASAALLERNRRFGRLLKGIFAVTDGARMPCAKYQCPEHQNAYFEGFTQGTEATNLLVWDFRGEIIHAGVNYPGSWHDSKVALMSGLYDLFLSDKYVPPGYAVLGDSAFPRTAKNTNGKLVRARKDDELGLDGDIPKSAYLYAVDTILQRVLPSERQSAEWGVAALKEPFKRLSVRLPADSYRRYRIITCCAHLMNLRTRLVGLSQIKTVYANYGTVVQPWIRHLLQETVDR